MFQLDFKPRALKALRKIDRDIQLDINVALNNARDGLFELVNARHIQGTKYGHRIRVGRWRVLLNLFSSEARDK